VSEEKTKKRVPVKRWIVLGLIILGALAAYGPISLLKPVAPTVVLPAESIWPGIWLTNTMLATLITDVLLILLAIGAYRFHKAGKLVPSGIYNAFEAIFEFLWNSVQGSTGKWARRVVPLVATIFLLIFVANMVKMIPGFESIGYLEPPHKSGVVYEPVHLFSLGSLPVYAIDPATKKTVVIIEDPAHEGEEEHAEEGEHALCSECQVIPFLRGSATDLNFTFALAVIAVVMTQVFGVMSLGPGYFTKFFQFRKLISGGVFGIIDFGVGFLELILEFAKILSFSFRLFGNIFAGVLLLSLVGALLPIIIPPGLYLFEIFFGIIQAYVFFLLATMFISMAVVGHEESHEEEVHGEEPVPSSPARTEIVP
jgi:F-type H+-transporting ATPase subunit a